MMSDFVCLHTCDSREQAEILRLRLESEGVQAFIDADDVGGLYPTSISPIGVRLMVKQAERDQAAAILSEDVHLDEDGSADLS